MIDICSLEKLKLIAIFTFFFVSHITHIYRFIIDDLKHYIQMGRILLKHKIFAK